MTGILLLNMGGPDSLKAVKPFLRNLFSDRDIIRLGPSFMQGFIASIIIRRRLQKTLHAYSLIGGKSPLPEITARQAEALGAVLNEGVINMPYYVRAAMRYWHPFIEDVLGDMRVRGIKEVIGVSLYPQYSRATSGSTIKVFESCASKKGLSFKTIASWCDDVNYIHCLSRYVKEGIDGFDRMPFVLFSAHSLPQSFVDQGDPYVRETETTVRLVSELLKLPSEGYCIAYQSKTGPVKWLEPTTEDTLVGLSRQGIRDVLIVPVSFVSDHIETLYEIDMVYAEMAKGLGIALKRSRAFNDDRAFVEVLKGLVVNCLK